MRKHRARPYSPSVRPTRMFSLILGVGILFLLYGRFKDPATWRTLLDLKNDPVAAAEAPPPPPPAPEIIVAGPNDQDPVELFRMQEMLPLVTDKTPLKPRDMHAYWKMLSWARTESSADLDKRALHEVPFTRLWEQPEKYRGKLISLRLHIRRVLINEDLPSNPQELKTCYEAWGWTEESRSFPYVLIFPDLPEGLVIGNEMRGEATFVGYFLKIMSYEAFDKTRGAPLLIGRMQAVASTTPPPPPPTDPKIVIGIAVIGTLLVGLIVWWQAKFRRGRMAKVPGRTLPAGDLNFGENLHEVLADNPVDISEREESVPPILQS